ncbi:MAG TPA: L-dopachrome tautomerase-related protein, partial [Chitinophagaceae bacterium]
MKHFIFLFTITIIFFSNCKKDDLMPGKTNTDLLSAAPSKADDPLELMYKDSLYQLTGVAVSKNGRLFTNYPLWEGPHKDNVVEVTSLHTSKPYPNANWNSWKKGEDGSKKWVCVQAVHIDDANRMWVVDPASPYIKGVYQHDYKLVHINLTTDKVERIYKFNYVADKGSYINDIRVDVASNFAYLTNSTEGGILVVDLTTGKMRQVLQGDPSVISNP